MLLLKSN